MDVAELLQWLGRGVVAVIFVGMGINHFRPRAARVMAKFIPPPVRRDGLLNPLNLVYATGVCEIAGGIGILLPSVRSAAAVGLVLFLVLVFPANAHAAANPGEFGSLSIPFWRRYFAQLALVLVVVLVAI